jgi:hypothetical protein
LAGALLLVACPALAERADEVVLYNGNTITGEVKSLQQGKLRFKTDHAGTIFVEWDFVHALSSASYFEVGNQLGELFYGTLAPGPEARQLSIRGADQTAVLDMDRVVEIAPIKTTFWQSIDGSVSLGFSYASADDSLQYSLQAQAARRRRKYSASVSLSSIETQREGTEDIFRESLELDYTRYHRKRYFGSGTLAFTRNSELGLDLRSEFSYAFGRFFTYSNRSVFSGTAGFAVSHENTTGDQDDEQIGWAVFGLRYRFFLYNFPETDVDVDFKVQPGLTEWPRTRVELSASLRREIIRDFTVNISVLDSYDTDPPLGAAAKNDLSATVGLGWTF